MTTDRPDTDRGLPEDLPPRGFAEIAQWPLGSAGELGRLRADLASRLSDEGYVRSDDADTPYRIVLIASELATNAIRHGRPPTQVRLSASQDAFLLEVTDHDTGGQPVFAGQRVLGDGGLGLHLARHVSQAVGWYASADTKTVWATFAR